LRVSMDAVIAAATVWVDVVTAVESAVTAWPIVAIEEVGRCQGHVQGSCRKRREEERDAGAEWAAIASMAGMHLHFHRAGRTS
jgi:hypothetical protein